MRKVVNFLAKSGVFEGNVIIGECEGTVRRGLILNLSGGVKDARGAGRLGRYI